MFTPGNITGVVETRRGVSAFTNNLTSVVGLLVLGFPVSPAAIRTMVVSWVLIAVAIMQFVLRRFRPEVSPVRIRTVRTRTAISDVAALVGGIAKPMRLRRSKMNAFELLRKGVLYTVAATQCLVVGSAAAQQQDQDDVEVQMGQEVFNELKAKGEIVESSPLYDQLRPIADAITRAAQPRYNHPFKFYLVHEAQPNAFAAPGGNVYVVDSLLYFVKNIDELAGTLCHEVSHTIHHDTVTLMEKQEKLEKREIGAAVLLGPTRAHVLTILLLGKLHSLGYSRDVESRADITGSDVCAGAGYNPWGLVWLFQDFSNADIGQVPQLLSDHPSDENRVQALEQHFRKDPSVFAKFNPDPKSAPQFVVPKNVAEVFLH
jgi:predicted Zn-dependent protease